MLPRRRDLNEEAVRLLDHRRMSVQGGIGKPPLAAGECHHGVGIWGGEIEPGLEEDDVAFDLAGEEAPGGCHALGKEPKLFREPANLAAEFLEFLFRQHYERFWRQELESVGHRLAHDHDGAGRQGHAFQVRDRSGCGFRGLGFPGPLGGGGVFCRGGRVEQNCSAEEEEGGDTGPRLSSLCRGMQARTAGLRIELARKARALPPEQHQRTGPRNPINRGE